MLADDPGNVVDLRLAHKTRVAVGQLLGPVFVDLLDGSRVVAPAMPVAGAEPALVVAHAVVDHLRVDLEQVEVQERRVVFAAVDLGLDAVAAAGPIELVAPFAEERPAVGLRMNWNSSVSNFTLASAMAAIGWPAWWSNWCHGGTHECTSRYAAVVP